MSGLAQFARRLVQRNGILQPAAPKALMKARLTEGGSVLVRCPYCIIYFRKVAEVDVTKFVDTGGREVEFHAECGHTLRFKSIAEWQENRQKLGVQTRG